ncbi:NLR family CARD domain-containing protein 3 [Hypomesus transpacificus]|uniref:NLR family CARD domain-containing protein 3 n=1 Tax=Hypomesus transpacificus TaxID=137520 RepID=UPI001F080287|nr:NLR family CARD domain-containing protein 3 [Hypomesus transpacificus]
MEKSSLCDFILDRNKRITWQGDCYVDLQSTHSNPSIKVEMEDVGWIKEHRGPLCRFTTKRLLEGAVSHMRMLELLCADEETQIKALDKLQDQVDTFTTILMCKEPQASDALRAFIENYDSQVSQLITMHDDMVKEHKEVLQHRFGPHSDSLTADHHGLNVASRALLLVDGLSDLQQKEHDLMQVEATRGTKRHHTRQLGLAKLLEPLSRISLPPRVSLTLGVSGIGKSTLVRSFVQLWCQGEICTDVSFILPLAFWELNAFEKISMEKLVKLAFPHLPDPSLVLSGSCRTLFILDGLDEFRCPLDFSEAAPCNDPKKEVPIDDLVTNIIRGNLLPAAAVWVTSRPSVGSNVPGGLVDRVTEIPGFSQKDIQLFLNNCFSDKHLVGQIWAHLVSNKIFMVMSYVPGICWILASTAGYLLQSGCQEGLPRTCTEFFSHFCSMKAEAGEPRGREPLKAEQLHGNRKLLGALGRLAFYGLLKHKHTFSEQDMRAYGVDLPSTQSSLGSGVLVREESPVCVAFRFTHLSIQEFLAATYYHTSSKRAIFDLFTESAVSWPKIGFQNHFRSALQRSQQAEDGHLDVFVRFLAGLLCPTAVRPLAGLLALGKDDNGGLKGWAAGLLQSLLASGGAVVSLRSVNIAYCLQELQHTELLRSVEEDLKNGSLGGKLTRTHCVTLAYLLHVSPECTEETNLSSCMDIATVKSLLPQLLYCSHLRLENNHFKDDVMELLGSLLSAKDCHIQKLSLADNGISNKGAKALSRALLVNRTLSTLDLRGNRIGAKGAKFLAEALKTNQVLVSINFQNNQIEEEGARALAEVLQSNRRLLSLNIQKNSIGPDGARWIANALKTNRTLTELILCSNQLGDKGTSALALGLMVNHSLLSLHLQSNSISDKGMTALTKALRSNHGLLFLNLRENSIGMKGARDMAKALQENNSLRDLDLTANLLHDEGVKAIAGAIKVNQALTSLHLQWNFIKCTATKALADALLTNTTMQLLDLQENAIGDEGVEALAGALKTNTSLCTLCLQGVSAGRSGAIALAEALMVNKSLHTLDLRGNTIGMEGAKALARALKTNRTLKSLNLQENSLGMDGAIFIATALKGNNQLTYINLQGNGIGESGAKVIADAIKTSSSDCIVEI